jgi:hypothetical protein
MLRAATAFSKAAVAAFQLSLVATIDERWHGASRKLHETLQIALDPNSPKNSGEVNYGWLVHAKMGLMLKDLLPSRFDQDETNDRFRMPVTEFAEYKRSRLRKRLNRYSPPKLWTRDPDVFFRLAENYRRISNECYRQLPKRARNDGRPASPERGQLLKWVQAQGLETMALSQQLMRWSRLLVTWGYPRDDMPPFADRRNADGTWLYRTEVDYAEAFAQWWDRRTELTYRRMRDVLKDTEKDAKRAEQKNRDRQ